MRFFVEPSSSSQPMKFLEAGFWTVTLQCPSSSAAPWASLLNWAKFWNSGGFVRPSGQTLPLSVTFLSPAVSCSVRTFMTVADGDTLALIMPVRAECCSTTGPACPSSASLVPPAPINTYQPGVTTSLLYSGSQFRGYQKSKGNSYDVEVVLQVMPFAHCVSGYSSISILTDVSNLNYVSSVFLCWLSFTLVITGWPHFDADQVTLSNVQNLDLISAVNILSAILLHTYHPNMLAFCQPATCISGINVLALILMATSSYLPPVKMLSACVPTLWELSLFTPALLHVFFLLYKDD